MEDCAWIKPKYTWSMSPSPLNLLPGKDVSGVGVFLLPWYAPSDQG